MTDDEVREALKGLDWSIGREGRKWSQDEMLAKADALPMKLEVMYGKLFWDDADRIRALASLLELYQRIYRTAPCFKRWTTCSARRTFCLRFSCNFLRRKPVLIARTIFRPQKTNTCDGFRE